jgi:hypothetical protein
MHAIHRDGQLLVRELRVEPDDDRVGMPGRFPAVETLLRLARGGVRGRDHVEAGVAAFALEAARADRQHPPTGGVQAGTGQVGAVARAELTTRSAPTGALQPSSRVT